MTREPHRQLQIQTTEPPDEGMLQVAPEFASDDEYNRWLERVHEEIPNEEETNGNYCEARED
jgi:hypothetical protein